MPQFGRIPGCADDGDGVRTEEVVEFRVGLHSVLEAEWIPMSYKSVSTIGLPKSSS